MTVLRFPPRTWGDGGQIQPPLLSVVIATAPGREHWAERAVANIKKTTPSSATETLVVASPTRGQGWAEGAARATGRYIALSYDDVQWHLGWWEQASSFCDAGFLPAPVMLTPDGKVQSCGGSVGRIESHGAVTAFTRAPFMSAGQYRRIRPLLTTQHFADNWISFRARRVGIATVVAHEHRCVYHDAQEGKKDVSEQIYRDQIVFDRCCSAERLSDCPELFTEVEREV